MFIIYLIIPQFTAKCNSKARSATTQRKAILKRKSLPVSRCGSIGKRIEIYSPVRYIFGRYLDKDARKKAKQSKHGAFICPVLRLNQHSVSVLKSMKAWITTNNSWRITADSDNILKPRYGFLRKMFLNGDFSCCFFFEPMI